MIKDDLKWKHVYIDSGVLIYLLENFESSQPLNDLKDMILNNEIKVSFDEYSCTEVLLHSIHKEKDEESKSILYDKVAEFLEMFDIIDLSIEITDKAASFGGQNEMDSLASFHVVSAVTSGCEIFLTNDLDIKVVPDGLKLIQFSDYELNLKTESTI